MNARGFTLLEMVITVLIFGIVGVIAVQLLSQTVRTTEKVVYRGEVLREWHRAMTILTQDITQINHRKIRDEFGDQQPALKLSTEGVIEFTRAGWHNTHNQQRSSQQRLSYYLYENQLIRRYWNVLDRAVGSLPIDQVLLENVVSVDFNVIDKTGQEHHFWPPSAFVETTGSHNPALAVRIEVELVELGVISQLWLVPVLPAQLNYLGNPSA